MAAMALLIKYRLSFLFLFQQMIYNYNNFMVKLLKINIVIINKILHIRKTLVLPFYQTFLYYFSFHLLSLDERCDQVRVPEGQT
jgi:hypothetical protein